MHIKNKFLRFLVSILTALILYFLLTLAIWQQSIIRTLGTMLYYIMGIPQIVPVLIIISYIIYLLLTQKENRSKPTIIQTIFIISSTIPIMVLLYFLA